MIEVVSRFIGNIEIPKRELDKQIYKCGMENLRMSGCHPPNTSELSILKLENAHHSEMIAKLEKIIGEISDWMTDKQNKIESIENGDCFDYDERIHDLENIEAEPRLCSLELQMKAKEFKADTDKGERWMECLAGLELKMIDRINDSEKRIKSIYGKVPHKCPVCFGRGFREDEFLRQHDCKSCENKGIVWG